MGKKVAEKIRNQIENNAFLERGKEMQVTVSLGVTSIQENDTEESVFQRADQALYKAKSLGKNQVVVFIP